MGSNLNVVSNSLSRSHSRLCPRLLSLLTHIKFVWRKISYQSTLSVLLWSNFHLCTKNYAVCFTVKCFQTISQVGACCCVSSTQTILTDNKIFAFRFTFFKLGAMCQFWLNSLVGDSLLELQKLEDSLRLMKNLQKHSKSYFQFVKNRYTWWLEW